MITASRSFGVGPSRECALGEVHRDGAAEDHRADHHPRGGEVEEALAELGVGVADEGELSGGTRRGHRAGPHRPHSALTLPAMVKIGRYIAMIIVPTLSRR
jgi:hypothetical protein